MGNPALATRHLTFLLQTMYNYLSPFERKEAALQLQSVSQQCEGSPVPFVRFFFLLNQRVELKSKIKICIYFSGIGFWNSDTTS